MVRVGPSPLAQDLHLGIERPLFGIDINEMADDGGGGRDGGSSDRSAERQSSPLSATAAAGGDPVVVADESPVPLSRPPSDPVSDDGRDGGSLPPVGDGDRVRDAWIPAAPTAGDRELAELLYLCGGDGVGDSVNKGWDDVRRWLREHW